MAKGFKAWERFPLGVTPVVRGRDAARARQLVGATQVAFANHMGVDVRSIRRWEQNPDGWITDPCKAREIKSILTWDDASACRW